MSSKNIIQEKIEKIIIENNCNGIVLSSVRSGKTKMILESIKKHSQGKDITIFLAYPQIDIKVSWENEMKRLNYYPKIIYSTFISLGKNIINGLDYYCFDEAHSIPSKNILPLLSDIVKNNSKVILASGTYKDETLDTLKQITGLKLIVDYPVEQAIKDGIISDYNVVIHEYSLSREEYWKEIKGKKWKTNEIKESISLANRISSSYGESKMFAALARMRWINSCPSLIKSVNQWINNNKNERFILFTGDENVGKNYNIPMFNSKSKSTEMLKKFQNLEIHQLCLIKKGMAGVTFPMLQNILITAINSNSENLQQAIGRGLLNDSEDTVVHIFVSKEEFQQKWLNSALEGIPIEKIKRI